MHSLTTLPLLALLLLSSITPAQRCPSPQLAQRPVARAPAAKDLAYLRSLAQPATTIASVIVNLNGVPTDIGDRDHARP